MTRSTPALGLAAALMAALLLTGCTEDVGTSVRVSLVYKDSWRMATADVVIAQSDEVTLENSAPISHQLLVLVPDSLAGNVMPLEVWGVRDGDRIAHGSAVALVRKGETVEATVVLDREQCGVFCKPGDVQCDGNGVSTCQEDEDGCLQWGEPKECPSETPFCSGGACGLVCADECVAGTGTCVDADTQRRCGEFDNDACRDFGPSVDCVGGEVCYSGRCALQCVQGALVNNAVAGGNGAFTPVIAVDAAGGSHALYSVSGTRQLRYGFRPRGGSWPGTWEDIPGAVGENPSLAIDKAGGLHLVAGGAAVIYGYRAPMTTTWQVTALETGVSIGLSSSIAVGDDGVAHVVYYRTNDQTLRYGRKGTPWALENVRIGVGLRCDLAIAGATLHVSSFDTENNLWHSMLEPDQPWASTMIKDLDDDGLQPAAATSIAVDRGGTVHLVYSDFYSSLGTLDDELRYLYRSGGSWTTTTIYVEGMSGVVDATGAYPDLAVDPFDRLHVAYRTTTTTPVLRYATKDAGTDTWSRAVQPAGTSGLTPSIAIDPLGNVTILSASTSVIETTRACQ